jgi:antitoxin component YwqK of YwqJK toxin-antitoxin module
MSITGASIIIWFYDDTAKQPILLTGKESKYMSDIPEYKDLVREKEVFNGTDLMQAKKYFSKNAKDLEEILQNKIGQGKSYFCFFQCFIYKS